MTRPFIGLLVLGFAAAGAPPATAQTGACTYDSCALRLQHRFFGGVSLVQGQEGRPVARLGLFARRVDVLASGSDSVQEHYQAFHTDQNRGGAFTLVGVVAAGIAGALGYNERRYQDHKTLFWGLLGVGLTFSVAGSVQITKASDHLQRSIWFYNRDLGRQ